MGALDAETRSSIPDVSAAKSDDARLPMLYPRAIVVRNCERKHSLFRPDWPVEAGGFEPPAFRNQIRCCRSWPETFFGNEVRHDNFNRDAHVRVLPPRAESLREFDSEMQRFESGVTNERRQMRALRDSECSGSDSQMQRFESRHLG